MTPASTALVAGRPVSDLVPGNATLADLIDTLATTWPARAAVTDASGTLTFRELRAAAFRLAKALQLAGVRRGDSVGILMSNGPNGS